MRAFSDATTGFAPNRVLGLATPLVNPEEEELPRHTRVTLARLRSGHCKDLKSFQFRIDAAISDLCPECDVANHSTNHLFECSTHPTNLAAIDLREKPWEVAEFLCSLPLSLSLSLFLKSNLNFRSSSPHWI